MFIPWWKRNVPAQAEETPPVADSSVNVPAVRPVADNVAGAAARGAAEGVAKGVAFGAGRRLWSVIEDLFADAG